MNMMIIGIIIIILFVYDYNYDQDYDNDIDVDYEKCKKHDRPLQTSMMAYLLC